MVGKVGGLRRIREVATWCESRLSGDGSDTLRSSEIRPGRLLFFDVEDETGVPRVKRADYRGACGAIDEVVEKRRRSILGSGATLMDAVSAEGGRILAFVPDLSLSEGASEELSLGFFDIDNQPPWDTWLAYILVGEEGYPTLLSWVPSALMERVEAGLDVNWERSVRWADASILESPEVQLLLDS